MIRYLCDIENCGKEAHYPTSGKEWIDQEMFDKFKLGDYYFWARVGIANKTFCREHKKEVMQQLVHQIAKRYGFLTPDTKQ